MSSRERRTEMNLQTMNRTPKSRRPRRTWPRQRRTARMMHTGDSSSLKTWSNFNGLSRIKEIPGNTVIALDVHGTLISRNQADDLRVVQAFRQTISRPAKEAG